MKNAARAYHYDLDQSREKYYVAVEIGVETLRDKTTLEP